ncbi:glycerophosphodiester phosphodiesterase family protein [Rhodococcus erythropolis]|uniref:glycerophosphodiester phosphodiesterase family protein n=1 Tax=Rhodococcus erythropolis TaxID=1833 RepID=UPI00366D05CE
MVAHTALSRRNVFRAATLLGLGLAGGSAMSACSDSSTSAQSPAHQFLSRGRYFIAQRGAGDEAPEHTLAAYSRIVDRGAEAISVAVHRTRDGILVCHEDPTLSRTSGQNIAIADVTHDELSNHPVDLTRWVGPDWGMHPIPTFSEVLERLGKRTVLFVESKDPEATTAVIGAVTAKQLGSTTVFTQPFTARESESVARKAGLTICTYFSSHATGAEIDEAADGSDAIGIFAGVRQENEQQQTLIQAAVATGKPVIAWSVNRRSQLPYLAEAGVRGFMSSSWSYLAGPSEPSPHDTFSTGRIAPGDLAGSNSSSAAPEWGPNGSMLLATSATPQSISMGSMCPVRAAPYVITVEAQFGAAPPLSSDHLAIVIGRDDDSSYRLGAETPGTGQGQLVVLRSTGDLELRSIPGGNALSVLQSSAAGDEPAVGQWLTLRIIVKEDSVTVKLDSDLHAEPTTVVAPRTGFGGYFTLARNYFGDNAQASFRNISVSYV